MGGDHASGAAGTSTGGRTDPVVAAPAVEPQSPDASQRPRRGHPHAAHRHCGAAADPRRRAFGTATHTRLEQQTQTLRAGVHQVPAILLEDTYPAPDSPDYAIRPVGTQNTALSRWTTPHGERTAAVPTDTLAKAGQTITISVDADGNLTGPIPDSQQNSALAVTAACGVWALTAGTVLTSTTLAHRLFHRNRLRHWAHEWKQFDTPPR
ncbi:Rv1733c family protein [Rhodococcus koreensis]